VVREALAELDQATVNTLELLVSELVGNSVRHGRLEPTDQVGLQIRTRGRWIRAEVVDRGRRFEPYVPVSKSAEDGFGWGLFTVDRTADRWGVIDGTPNRRVWFELQVPTQDEQPSPTSPRFDCVFPARPDELRRIRSALRRWMEERGIPPQSQSDLLIALGEATANAVEHAYVGREPGEVYVEIIDQRDEAVARVRDFGRWRAPVANGEDRGRGIPVMREVSAAFSTEPGAEGTTVAMRFRIADRT
jgi:anti-sigma regulatory factor (Ser/Thr protein kinase)